MGTIGNGGFSRVGGGLSFTSGSLQAQRKTATDSLSEALSPKSEGNAAKIDVTSPSLGAAAQAIDTAGALATANDAISSIEATRQRQLELAKAAEATSNLEQRNDINTEISALEDEVSRIASSATYAGSNVLSSGISSTFQDENGNDVSVVTGNASSLTSDLGLDVSSVTGATSAIDSLNSALSSIYSYQSGIDAASTKTNEIIQRVAEPRVSQTIESTDRIATAEEAERLANQVASEIRSAANGGSPESTLSSLVDSVTSSLNPERVTNLLNEN